MKVKVKEFYEEGDGDGLSSIAPVASIVITDDSDEYLYETYITKAELEDMKRREREYKEAKERKENSAKRGELLIEYLAELEHKQWCAWSREMVKTEDISSARRTRWESLWIPYGMLSEETKEYDRKWARETLRTVRDNEDFWMKKDARDKQNRDAPTRFMDQFKAIDFVAECIAMGNERNR
jgi:hypothetical protein